MAGGIGGAGHGAPHADRATSSPGSPCMEGSPCRPLSQGSWPGQRSRRLGQPASPQGSRASCSQPHPVPSPQGPPDSTSALDRASPVSLAWPARPAVCLSHLPSQRTQAAGLGASVRELTSPFSAQPPQFSRPWACLATRLQFASHHWALQHAVWPPLLSVITVTLSPP